MFIHLHVSSPPCCLLGNTCHSVVPQLARPLPGRTQASPDAKPLLPFHLLPRFTDVSTVSPRLRRLHSPALKKRKIITPPSIVQFVTLHFLLQVKEFMCLRGVIFQCTDAWASCPHLSKYTTSDAVSCDISTRPGGELFPWYSLYTAFVCPRCLWRLKVERTNAVQVQALKRVDVMWFTGESCSMSSYTSCCLMYEISFFFCLNQSSVSNVARQHSWYVFTYNTKEFFNTSTLKVSLCVFVSSTWHVFSMSCLFSPPYSGYF